MTYIHTHSGAKVNIEDPRPETIHIEDIAHALTFLCRGGGNTNVFFPVSRHCVYGAQEAIARGLDEHLVLTGEFFHAKAAALEEAVHDHGKGEGVVLVEGGPAVAVGLEVGEPGDGVLEFGVFAFFLLEHKPSP